MKTKKVLYIVSNIFSHHIAHTLFTPVLRFSPIYHPYIPFTLHPALQLPYAALHCNSLHFTSLHFTTLLCTFMDKVPEKKIVSVNHLTPNGHYTGRTAPLTSRCYILYIYSTNIRTEYFKYAA